MAPLTILPGPKGRWRESHYIALMEYLFLTTLCDTCLGILLLYCQADGIEEEEKEEEARFLFFFDYVLNS